MKYQVVEVEGKFGCQDDNGRWVLMSEYDDIKLSNNCAVCWKNNKIQVYNFETNAFLLECEKIREDKDGFWAFYNEGKWGVLSTFDSGRIIINNVDDAKQLKQSVYSVFHDGYYEIANSRDCYARHIDAHPVFYDYNRILAKKKDKFGFINSDNYTSIPFIYDEISERWDEGLFDVRIGEAWGILSIDGREIVQVKYSRKVFDPNYYYDDFCWRSQFDIVKDSRSGRIGIINREGKEVIPPIYNNAHIISMESMPNDWKYLLPDFYPKKYSLTDAFLLEATAIEREDYYGDSDNSSGLFDISGNIIVPVAYESFSYAPQGYIIASQYQGQLFGLYNINGGGKRLLPITDRLYHDKIHERFYLFGILEMKIVEHDAIEVLDYCIPIDYSLKTILKNTDGESLQLNSETTLSEISDCFKISLGGIEQKREYYYSCEYSSVIFGDSIVFKKEEKQGICYIKSQTFSPLYDELIYQYEPDLFIVRVGERSGLILRGQEILQPIYFGISTVDDGFCFIIKENYSLFDVDFIHVEDISKSHITAFMGLSKDDIMKMLRGNYLYFQVRDSEVLFNNECPFHMTEEFQSFISKERIPLVKDDWVWGVY